MKANMGSLDRLIRAIIGIGVIAWGYATGNWLGALGLILLVTAVVSWCPAYVPFKISTRKTP